MTNIWEKAFSILSGSLNSGLSYLTTTVLGDIFSSFTKIWISSCCLQDRKFKKKWIHYFFCLESCRWWQPLILKSTNFHYVLITYNFIQATIWNLHHLKSQLLVFINGLEKVTKIWIQCLRAKCFLTERNMQVRFDLKVVLKFLDIEILIIRTSFHEMHTIDHMFSEHFPFSLLPKLLSDKMFFYGKWCCPSPSSTQKLRFRAFIWGIVCLYRILKKAGQNILSFWWNSVVKINYDIPLI